MSVTALLVALGASAGGLSAQVAPPVTDTAEVLEEPVQDTAVFHRAPAGVVGPTASFATGIDVWDRTALLGSRATTLDELLREIPGLVQVRSGDHGLPRTVSWGGGGGGNIRVFRDGIELFPLRGSVEDLSLVGLSGIEEVRVERYLSEIRVRLRTLEPTDVRPYTLIETGQGDFNTNLFRGTLLLPNALGGSVALGIDRIDTRGARGQEPGVAQGAFFRYARHWGDAATLALTYRRRSADRDTLFDPEKLVRSELAARLAWAVREGLVLEAGVARSGLALEGDTILGPDSIPFADPSLDQVMGRLSLTREGFSGLGEVLWQDGDGVAPLIARVGGGFEDARYGSVWVEGEHQDADGVSGTSTRVLASTARFGGTRLFASIDRGSPIVPPTRFPTGVEGGEGEDPEVVIPLEFAVGERNGLRAGADLERWGIRMGAAWNRVEVDSFRPLGLIPESSDSVLVGGEMTGLEVSGFVPLMLLDGLEAGGSYQRWDETPGYYMPEQVFVGQLRFHDTFRENDVLEIWAEAGAEGRDGMLVPALGAGEGDPAAVRVGHSINWFGRLQIRIATVSIYLNWDNLAYRETNQDLPGRFLPSARAFWGVRWVMWN